MHRMQNRYRVHVVCTTHLPSRSSSQPRVMPILIHWLMKSNSQWKSEWRECVANERETGKAWDVRQVKGRESRACVVCYMCVTCVVRDWEKEVPMNHTTTRYPTDSQNERKRKRREEDREEAIEPFMSHYYNLYYYWYYYEYYDVDEFRYYNYVRRCVL